MEEERQTEGIRKTYYNEGDTRYNHGFNKNQGNKDHKIR